MTNSGPKVLLHLEGLAVFGVGCFAYAKTGSGWLWFALFFLAPDLSMMGYALGRRVGALCDNVFHTYALPLALGAAGIVMHAGVLESISALWLAHIGLDR